MPNGLYAFGRLYKDCTLGIYSKICDSYDKVPDKEDYLFFVSVYKDLLIDGEWEIVGKRPFISDEEAWPPKRCLIDAITKEGSIYYKGEIIPCEYEECKDLEIAAVWDRHHLVDRIMGDEKWLKALGRPLKS